MSAKTMTMVIGNSQGSSQNDGKREPIDSKCSACRGPLTVEILKKYGGTIKICTKNHPHSIATRQHCNTCCDNSCVRCGCNLEGIAKDFKCTQPNFYGKKNQHCHTCCDATCDYTKTPNKGTYNAKWNAEHGKTWQI